MTKTKQVLDKHRETIHERFPDAVMHAYYSNAVVHRVIDTIVADGQPYETVLERVIVALLAENDALRAAALDQRKKSPVIVHVSGEVF